MAVYQGGFRKSKIWRRSDRHEAVVDLGAGGCSGVAVFAYCWQLISGKDHLDVSCWDAPQQAVRPGAAAWCRPNGPTWTSLWLRHLGHVEHCHPGHFALPSSWRCRSRFCAARNTTPSVLMRAASGAVHHRVVALDQFPGLGA